MVDPADYTYTNDYYGRLEGFFTGCAIYAGVGILMCILLPIYVGYQTKDPSMVTDNKW